MSRREVLSGLAATGRGRIPGNAAVVNYDGPRTPPRRVTDGADPSGCGRYGAAESPNSPARRAGEA
jgi:hypothetical protein